MTIYIVFILCISILRLIITGLLFLNSVAEENGPQLIGSILSALLNGIVITWSIVLLCLR